MFNDFSRNLGIFDATGPAMIIEIKDPQMNSLSNSDLRLFFKPLHSTFSSLRVKPTTTKIYGPEMRVFAVPPAPSPWVTSMQTKLAQRPQNSCLDLKVMIYSESLNEVKYTPFGVVVYRFWNSSRLAQEKRKEEAQKKEMQESMLLVSCFIYFQVMTLTASLKASTRKRQFSQIL